MITCGLRNGAQLVFLILWVFFGGVAGAPAQDRDGDLKALKSQGGAHDPKNRGFTLRQVELGFDSPALVFGAFFSVQNANNETEVSFLGEREGFEATIGGRPPVDRDVRNPGDLLYLARWEKTVRSCPSGIHRLISSSIIGSTAADVRFFGALSLATIVFLLVFREKLLLLAMDPAIALAVGMNRRSWEIATILWLGFVAGLSIRSAGMFYTFGCLVLPALTAKTLCKAVRPMFLVVSAVYF